MTPDDYAILGVWALGGLCVIILIGFLCIDD